MKSKLTPLVFILANLIYTAVSANPVITCENDPESKHHFKVTMADERVTIDERWNGAYVTYQTISGYVQPVGEAIILRIPYTPHTIAVLTRGENNTRVMDYSGFLEPNDIGRVTLDCDRP
ncbi:MAG: hypothetical protein KDD37_10250 [Bdellovibrionales bacterium]|nr:hypothetical protein [Bdellovibrionales bacterium]